MKKIDAIFIDLDRTLCEGKKPHIVSLDNIHALKKAQREGINIVIATGRDTQTLKGIYDQIRYNDNSRFWIHSNGAILTDFKTDTNLWEEFIDEEEHKKLLDYLKSKNCVLRFPLNRTLFRNRKNFFTWLVKVFLKVTFADYDQIPDYAKIDKRKLGFFPMTWKKGTVKFAKEISEMFPGITFVQTGSGLYIEANKKGISKGFAATELMKINNWKPENCVAIGDSMNDYEIFKVVGTRIAMSNAMKELKKIATHITTDAKHHGVAKAINELMEEDK